NAYDESEVAVFLGDLLLARYPALLAQRYTLPLKQMDGVALVEVIARQRSLRAKGGEFDLEKAAITLLQDFRSGALGRISLETPITRASMLTPDDFGL
ncbi:MAG: ribosome biogenesis GTPase YlqF, partial [Gallionella sp.]|nr:ribosome biogenesis GTPase YlqF [Gallionella sp.]